MVHDWQWDLALVTLLVAVMTTIEFAVGNRSLRRLRGIPPLAGTDAPRVSVVIAARNEARNIEAALASVLRQDYAAVEVIIVDDRSTDETGAILDRMATGEPRLRVIHLTELPGGWLGKTHALHGGAEIATGDWLLFTDADVVMERTVVSRALSCALEDRLDHLAMVPQMTMRGLLLNMFGGAFAIFFGLYAKPWNARDPKSQRFVGIGAFNLVRAEAYRAAGGHRAIAMRPDDDMKLGKLLKKAGNRQDLVLGEGLLTVEWYSSVRELIVGLEKNSFAGLEYNLAAVVVASLAQWAAFVWPVVALFLTGGATRWLNAGVVGAWAVLYFDNAGFHGMKRWHGIALPLTTVLFQYIIWRAVLKTLVHRGIDWRGTRYTLAELKANKV